MKKINSVLSIAFCLAITFATGCKKTEIAARQNGTGSVKFSIEFLPGAATGRNDLYAVFSITNIKNEVVIADRTMPLTYNGKYLTQDISLPAGNYKLVKFLVFDQNNIIRYATPFTNSARATEVRQALKLSFTVDNNTKTVDLDVAGVSSTDTPASFGYAPGTFLNRPGQASSIKIKVHPVIQIGDVTYDSIPVTFIITTWDINNNETVETRTLPAGISEVIIPNSAIRLKLKTTRWGITDEMMLAASDVFEGTTYTLGGARVAKKIKSVLIYKLIGENYKPETKAEYKYDIENKLASITHFGKDINNGTILTMTDEVFYNQQNKVDRMRRKDANGNMIYEERFAYHPDGKILRMTKQEVNDNTTADVTYVPMPGKTGLTNNYKIEVFYRSVLHYYTTNYSKIFEGGNMVQDMLVTSHGNSQAGYHVYDFNINPFIQLHLPDLFLSNLSKHNKITGTYEYQNSFPEFVPYDEVYSYDSEGYPTQVIIKYKSSQTGAFQYQTKTVFTY